MKNSDSAITTSPYLLTLMGIFLACLIAANIMAVKLISIGGLVLPAAIVVFPVSYIVADILTEVYGYKQASRVIWVGFFCNLMVVAAFWIGQVLPPAPFWEGQEAYARILGYTPRLLAASFVAYLVGEFLNAYVLAKMKIVTRGRWLWARTIGSTLAGEGIDSVVFITLAFIGTMPAQTLIGTIITRDMMFSANLTD
ncbi:MAG TPA: VUT family protein [Desulfobacterales bacterium]|nr:VUT family protein [Desulfobacterales bacterium]